VAGKQQDEKHYPLEPSIVLEFSVQPEHSSFTRYLTFQDCRRHRKRLPVAFRRTDALRWEADSFPEGIDVLRSLADQGNRTYWDHMFLENRGGRTTLRIQRLQIIMRYDNPPGLSPENVNHAEIPIVDRTLRKTLYAGNSEIRLDPYARSSRRTWCGLLATDPYVIRAVADDVGKSGSDGPGQDRYGRNPKYGAGLDNLCSEFVSWYYHQASITVNGKSLRDIIGTQELHDLFKAEGTLYRYNSGVNLRSFVHRDTGARYTPKPGDFLERRGEGKAQHSMILFRWLPEDRSATNTHHQYHRAIVFNGPWPVTLRQVRIHEDEINDGVDFWLGRID
jgi:hypothetical protein